MSDSYRATYFVTSTWPLIAQRQKTLRLEKTKDDFQFSICIQFVLIVCWFVLLAASPDYFSSSMNSQKNVLGRQSTQGRPTTQIFSSATSLSSLQPKCWSTFCHRCPRRMTLQTTCIKMNAGSRGARMCWLQIQEKSRGMGRVDLRWIWECLRCGTGLAALAEGNCMQ